MATNKATKNVAFTLEQAQAIANAIYDEIVDCYGADDDDAVENVEEVFKSLGIKATVETGVVVK